MGTLSVATCPDSSVSNLVTLSSIFDTIYASQLSCYEPKIYCKRKLYHYCRWRTSLSCRGYNIIAKINVIAIVRSAPGGQWFVIYCYVPSTHDYT